MAWKENARSGAPTPHRGGRALYSDEWSAEMRGEPRARRALENPAEPPAAEPPSGRRPPAPSESPAYASLTAPAEIVGEFAENAPEEPRRAPARVSAPNHETSEPRGMMTLRALKAARVRYIMTLMVTGGWIRGGTGPELARQWGLEVSSVEQYSAEAARRLDDAVGDAEAMKKALLARLESVSQSAAADPADRGNATRAIELQLKAYGFLAGKGENVLPAAPKRPQSKAEMKARLLEALRMLDDEPDELGAGEPAVPAAVALVMPDDE